MSFHTPPIPTAKYCCDPESWSHKLAVEALRPMKAVAKGLMGFTQTTRTLEDARHQV